MVNEKNWLRWQARRGSPIPKLSRRANCWRSGIHQTAGGKLSPNVPTIENKLSSANLLIISIHFLFYTFTLNFFAENVTAVLIDTGSLYYSSPPQMVAVCVVITKLHKTMRSGKHSNNYCVTSCNCTLAKNDNQYTVQLGECTQHNAANSHHFYSFKSSM